MRTFTVTASAVVDGLAVSSDSFPHVAVGEEGRGRTLVRVHLEGLPVDRRIDRASVLRTQDDRIVLCPERGEDRRALVLADIAAVFRGTNEWTAAVAQVASCPNQGEVACKNSCPLCGADYEDGVGCAPNRHPQTGVVRTYDPFPPAGIKVIAEGYKAQGDAGRMGGHAVRLLIMEPGTCFRVKRNGWFYGEPRGRIVGWDGDRLTVGEGSESPPSTAGAEVL